MDAPVIAKKASYTASLLLMTAVVLGGCANPDDIVIKKCPAAATLPEAQTLTRFKDGTGRDLIDVNFNGKIIGITGSCSIDVDEDTGEGTIEMKVRPRFEFTRGPANHDSQCRQQPDFRTKTAIQIRILDKPDRHDRQGQAD